MGTSGGAADVEDKLDLLMDANDQILERAVRPKLKFDLFPLTRPTLKKALLKNFISIFSQELFFLISLQIRELVNVNSIILANCLCI